MHVALLGQAPKAVSALARHVQAERIVAETQRCLHMPGWHDRPRRGEHISPHGAEMSIRAGTADFKDFVSAGSRLILAKFLHAFLNLSNVELSPTAKLSPCGASCRPSDRLRGGQTAQRGARRKRHQ